MSEQRKFPPPWSVETIPGGLKVCDANSQSLAYVYSRENPNDAHMAKVLTQDEALRIASNIARAPNLNARDSSKTPSKPANELEGLIRDKLPDPVRRHLIDVIIDRTDADGLAANWTAQPVWSHEVSNNDKAEFIRAMFEVLRDYDLLTDD
jgi:hypothetical protein